MTHIASRSIAIVGTRRATRWPRVAIASGLLLGASFPSHANDLGSIIGGVVGGLMQQQRSYYQQPQYYQAQPQYYYQQPQYRQPQRQYTSGPTAAQRKAQQDRAKLEKEKKEQKEQEEAAARVQPMPAAGGAAGPIDVAMRRKNGNLWVPGQINKVVTIDFVIDSGASDITLPRDVYLTLIRSGTLTKANFVGNTQFGIADGSEIKGLKFKLSSLQVGNQVLTDVVASVMPSDTATPLLGLSFLSRFQSWAIDNNAGMLKLTPMPSVNAKGAAPTQVAAATTLPMPDQTTIAPPAAETTAPTPAQLAAVSPQTEPAAAAPQEPAPAAAVPSQFAPVIAVQSAAPAAAPTASAMPQQPTATVEQQMAAINAPRSGRVASSAFIVKETPTSAAAPSALTVASIQPNPKGAVPVFPANTPYASARSSLLALGYGPAPLPDAGKCDSNTDSTCFPERAACAKAEGIQCDFLWRRGDQLIKVKTVAVPPTIAAVECQVNCK